MCEASAYIVGEDGREELVLESVDKLIVDGQAVHLVDIFGRQESFRARIKALALLDHKILLERV